MAAGNADAMMVPFTTAGALDGAQVERRVAPLEPRAVAAGLRTRGWRGRRAGTGPTYTLGTKGPPRRRAPVRGFARACRRHEDGVPPGRRRSTVEASDGGGGERATPAASDNG